MITVKDTSFYHAKGSGNAYAVVNSELVSCPLDRDGNILNDEFASVQHLTVGVMRELEEIVNTIPVDESRSFDGACQKHGARLASHEDRYFFVPI